jgi:type IV pilus assembly protein PilV
VAAHLLEVVVRSRIQKNRRESGFALIEALVAVLVLSFGLLGMVGLQASALQNNREARYQSVAVSLAQELAEMMRGNKDVAMETDATKNPYLGDFSGTSLSSSSSSNCLSSEAPCAAKTDVAAAELADWLARLDKNLPGARATICLDSKPYDDNKGLPQWTCTGTSTGVIVIKIGWSHLSTDAKVQDRTIRTNSTSADNRPGVILPVTAGSITL